MLGEDLLGGIEPWVLDGFLSFFVPLVSFLLPFGYFPTVLSGF